MIYFYEDLSVGDVFESGGYEVTEEEIISFARDYDPQPFHVLGQPLIESLYEGLIASGWHIGAVCIRQMADALLLRCAVYCSPGVGDVRFHAPMFPGDVVKTRLEIMAKRPPGRDPRRAAITLEAQLSNSAGQLLLSMRPTVLFARREVVSLLSESSVPPGGQ